MCPRRCRPGRRGGRRAGGRGRGEVAGDGEDGGGHQMPVPGPLPYGQAAQGGGEEPGGERVTGADGGDDVHPERGDVGHGVGPPLAGPGEDGGALRAPLDDEDVRLGQRRPDGPRTADAPDLLRLVLPDEDQVAAAGQLHQHLGPRVAAPPQAGPVVDVKGEQGAAGAGGGQRAEQGQAVGGERGGDAGQVQDTAAEEDVVGDVVRGHRGGGGARAVVRHLVDVGGPVRRGAEVDAGGAVRVAVYGGGVHPVRADGLDEVVPEAVRADPADPCDGVSGRGQGTGDVGLGAADGPGEGGDVGEAAGPRGQERHHGLAEADDVRVRGGCPGCGSGHAGSSWSAVGAGGDH